MLRVEEVFDDLSGAHLFTTLDLVLGFWQLKLTDEVKEKTTFIFKYGIYHLEAMHFGLMNSPSTFQCTMESIFGAVSFVQGYLDNIGTFSENLDDHVEHVNYVRGMISKNKTKLEIRKCFFDQKWMSLIGNFIADRGVKVDFDEILDINETPAFISKTEIRSFWV